MWSEIRCNGKVKFSERYENPLTGKLQKVSVTLDKDTAATRKQAQSVLNDKITAALNKISVTTLKHDMTLSELIDLYRIYQKKSVAGTTYNRNYHECNMFMSIFGGNTLVDRLTAGYVMEQFSKHDKKAVTINERITRFKALIRWGYRNDYIKDISWLDKIKKLPDKSRKAKLEDKYLEKEELHTLLDYMQVEKWKLFTQLNALSGLRVGEAIALELDDIDFDNHYIYIVKNYDYMNNEVVTPKTPASIRDIYMQPELESVLHKIKAFSLAQKLKYGYDSNLLFCDINGQYIEYYTYNKYLKENAAHCLDKKIEITTHVMRHTHTALMAEAGVPLDVISRRLGHENSQITKDIYYHITKKMRERDNEKISAVSIL